MIRTGCHGKGNQYMKCEQMRSVNLASKHKHPSTSIFHAVEIVSHENNRLFACRRLQTAQYGCPDFSSSALYFGTATG